MTEINTFVQTQYCRQLTRSFILQNLFCSNPVKKKISYQLLALLIASSLTQNPDRASEALACGKPYWQHMEILGEMVKFIQVWEINLFLRK